MYDFIDDIVLEFESVAKASEETGIPKSNIARYCRGVRKQPDGFCWEYK